MTNSKQPNGIGNKRGNPSNERRNDTPDKLVAALLGAHVSHGHGEAPV